jgi:hypothetical protein
MDDMYVPSAKNRDCSLLFMYGWRDYGDRLRPGWASVTSNNVKVPSYYNDTHVGAMNFFHQYLRTMDKRWWELGEIASRHWMDIDVSHCNRKGYWDQSSAAGGRLGPGEGMMINHEVIDHDCRNIHPGHAHLSGLPDLYLLTGDKRSLEVINEVGSWWTAMASLMFKTPIDSPHEAEAERDFGWPLFTMLEAYRATGTTKYLQGAAQEIKHLIAWWQTPSNHYQNGVVVSKNDYRQGTGWWYMYPRCDNSPAPTQNPDGSFAVLWNGTNPWMAGPLIANVMRFREYNADVNLAADSTLRDMVLQTLQYVTAYGWNDSAKFFSYCEAAHDADGGYNHLLYPLINGWADYSKGGLAHPAWFAGAPKWLTIATDAYNDYRTVKNRSSTSLGFYGYEIVYPLDFFTLMARGAAVAAPPAARRPPALRLHQCAGGNGAVLFTVTLPQRGNFTLYLCDILGRTVRSYSGKNAAAGVHRVSFKRSDEKRCAGGILIAKLSQAEKNVVTSFSLVQ